MLNFWLFKNCIYCGVVDGSVIDFVILLGDFVNSGRSFSGFGLFGLSVLFLEFEELLVISEVILLRLFDFCEVFICRLIGEYVLEILFILRVFVKFDGVCIFSFLFVMLLIFFL